MIPRHEIAHLRAPSAAPIVPTLAEQEALAFLIPLSQDYPDFELWFRIKVLPGLRVGTRKLIRVERNTTLVGIGIAKKDETEQKICTVRIAQPFFGRGFGVKIFDSLLQWVETDKPHLTVSETKLPLFQRIFDHYGFRITSANLGRYTPNVTEFSFNECGSRQRVDKRGNSGF